MQGHALTVETEIAQTIIARGGDSLSRSIEEIPRPQEGILHFRVCDVC
jgi:hypothetical protein